MDLPYIVQLFGVTDEMFDEMVDEDTKAELLDGVMIVHSPASMRHDLVGHFLRSLVGDYAEDRELGAVYGPDSIVRLRRSRRFAPDLFFLAAARVPHPTPQEFEGVPDLILEVLSPSNRDYDLGQNALDLPGGWRPGNLVCGPHRGADSYRPQAPQDLRHGNDHGGARDFFRPCRLLGGRRVAVGGSAAQEATLPARHSQVKGPFMSPPAVPDLIADAQTTEERFLRHIFVRDQMAEWSKQPLVMARADGVCYWDVTRQALPRRPLRHLRRLRRPQQPPGPRRDP